MKNDTAPTARSARRSAGLQSILNLVLFFVILLMINYLGFKYYAHRDLSFSQYYALSPKTKEALKKLDGPLTIYTFLNPNTSLQSDQITTLLKEYQRVAGKNILIEKIDGDFDPARAAELQSRLHFDAGDYLIIFDKGKDHAPLFIKQSDLYEMNPMTQQIGAFKGEQLITATLLSVIEGKPYKIYFTEGHGEHRVQDTAKTGYSLLAAGLKNDNITTASLNLAQKGEVPADADAIVIAGPSIQFAPVELQALDKYLAANGKLLLLVDPYVVATGLNDLLGKYGMTFDNDLVLYRADNMVDAITHAKITDTYPIAYIYQGGFSAQPITARFARANFQLQIQNARSLTLAPASDKATAKTQYLLQTDANAWGWVTKEGTMSTDLKTLTFNKATDIPGPVTVAAAYDGGSTLDPTKGNIIGTRIVAVGSSRFVENTFNEDFVAANFFTNSLDWLVKKDAILEIAPKKPQQYGVNLSPMQFRTVVWCALFFIPGAALVLGIITWLSRRK